MDAPLVAVVLAGGTGTRLYPASRADRPKQFCALDGDRSLLRRTAERVSFADETVVVTGERHADRIPDHAPDADLLVEPAPRDTGPALVYAARECRARYGECVLLCVPADHHVDGDFEATARTAARAAADTGGLVTLGVEPTRPATGYGYIRPERALDASDEATEAATENYAPVERFEEKPAPDRAERLVAEGCLWNAGIFAWTPTAFLRECEGTPLEALADAPDEDLDDAVCDADPVSVDYAVLERTDEAYVVPATFAWDDLGSWDALERLLPADEAGNVTLGDAVALDAAGNVLAGDDSLVTVAGVDDLIVAAFDDRVLVVPKAEAQRVREVVAELERRDLF